MREVRIWLAPISALFLLLAGGVGLQFLHGGNRDLFLTAVLLLLAHTLRAPARSDFE